MGSGSLSGTRHTPWLSWGQMVHLPAGKKREKKKCIGFTAVCAAKPHIVVFQERGQQLTTTTALSISGHGQTQRHLQIGEPGVSRL